MLLLITSIKADPAQSLDTLLSWLNISKSQFYKDKNLLAKMGFRFHLEKECFVVDSKKWRQATRMLFDQFVLKEGFGCSPDILNALQNACLENRRIVIEYKKPDQSAFQKYEFDPYLVYFQNRSMYMDGFCPTRSDYRTFKIVRIKSVSKTTITFSDIYRRNPLAPHPTNYSA